MRFTMKKLKLSAVVLTKNEEKNIERCLKSVRFCDEIIVVDDCSKDKTIDEVYKVKNSIKLKGLKVFQRCLNGDFSQQRNFAMEKARGEWILFIDGDEEISDKLQKEIVKVIYHKFQIVNSKQVKAYYIKRRDFFWGREVKHGEAGSVKLIRLVRKNSGRWEGKVHEKFKVQDSRLSEVGSFNHHLYHYPHPTVKEFLREVNFYSSLRAEELYTQGEKTNLFEIVFYPTAKFFVNYFLKLGFLDGPVGFVYAFMMSFHSFLVRAKLYFKVCP